MCCWTHPAEWQERHPDFEIAANENWQCRCGYGAEGSCPRKATQEDLLCEVCSDRVTVDEDIPVLELGGFEQMRVSDYWTNPPDPGLTDDVPMPDRIEMARGLYQQIDWERVKIELSPGPAEFPRIVMPTTDLDAIQKYIEDRFKEMGDGWGQAP